MVRIALVVPAFERRGGVSTVGRSVHEILRRRGYQVERFSLATSWRDAGCTRLLRPWEWARRPGIREVTLETGEGAQRFGARFAEWELQRYKPRREIDRVLAGFDLIFMVTGSAVWANACLDVGPPVLVQVATTLRAERASATRHGVWRWAWQRFATTQAGKLETHALRRVAGVFVENQWMNRFVRSLRGDDTVFFAPPGIDADFFQPAANPVRRHILFVGRIDDPRKNVDLLLDAYAACVGRLTSMPPLVLAGYCGPTSAQEQRMRRLGITDCVRVVTTPLLQELRALYQNALFLALSSNEEGLGMVLLESLACGTAVISTDCGGPRTIVRPEKNGLLIPVKDAPALTEAMLRLVRDPGLAAAFGREGRRDIEREFSLDASGAKFDAAIRRVLVGLPQPAGLFT